MKIDDELIDKHPIHPEAEALIRSSWADRTAYGIAGQSVLWHDYVDDLAQEARLQMWHDAEKWDPSFGGDIVPYCKQRGRWAILGVVSGQNGFTGQERAVPVAQKRGDEAREKLKATELYLRHSLKREPTVEEVADALGIGVRTVYKQRASIKKLPGPVSAPSVRSLEELLTAAGNEGALIDSHDTEAVALAYHYGEIHETLRDLPAPWREYIWLRFWEGWTEGEIRAEGIHVNWSDVRPHLAERLHHLTGVM